MQIQNTCNNKKAHCFVPKRNAFGEKLFFRKKSMRELKTPQPVSQDINKRQNNAIYKGFQP